MVWQGWILSYIAGWAALLAQADAGSPVLPPQPASIGASVEGNETASAPVPTPHVEPEPDGPITGPRDLLRRFGIDDSQFERLADFRPLGPDDEETMLRVMYRLDRFRLVDIEGWAEPRFHVEKVFPAPNPARGKLFWISGRVTEFEKFEPLPEVAERFELPVYYRCTLHMEPQGQAAQVFVKNIPVEWKIQEEPLNERVTAYGIFLKFAGSETSAAMPVFVSRRIAWHPPTLLGNLGMDVSLLEDIENRRPLTSRDREAFYQLLAAAGRAKPGQLAGAAREALPKASKSQVWTDPHGEVRWSVVPLFNDPERQHGTLIELEGTARRAERIEVRDPDIVARFGIDHYYQIALFTQDSQGNPLWFCVRELPEDMPLGADAEYAEHVRVAGFFFKTWAYRRGQLPEDISENQTAPWQLAPLLIGSRAVWYPPTIPRPNPYIGAVAGGLFVLTLIGVWIAAWQYSRGDREFHRRTIAKEYAVEPGVSLDEMGIEASPEPDFRYLAENHQPATAAEPVATREEEPHRPGTPREAADDASEPT